MKIRHSVTLVCALLAAVSVATAGTFSTRSLTGDADSGISGDKAYTHAISMGDAGNSIVNGAVFTGSGAGGFPGNTSFATSGLPDTYGGWLTHPVGGATGGLFTNFNYNGASTVETLTLEHLRVGQQYTTSFYQANWSGPRAQHVIAGDGVETTFDGDALPGSVLEYTFTAFSTSLSFTFIPLQPAGFHHYAFTNQALGQKALFTDNFYAPFNPNTFDLNFNNTERQGGSLVTGRGVVTWVGTGNAQTGSLTGDVDAGNYLLTGFGGKAAPDYNFNAANSAGGLSISFDLAPNINGGFPPDWEGLQLGVEPEDRQGAVDGDHPHLGVLFRGDGHLQAFDGSALLTPLEPAWRTGEVTNALNHIELLLTDPVDGNPFDGAGQTAVEVFANGTLVWSYSKGGGGYRSNYISFQASTLGGIDNLVIARILPVPATGDLDPSFVINANGPVNSMAVQPDTRIVLAGEFAFVNNLSTGRIMRYNAGGTLDGTFSATASSYIYSAGVQPDGDILAGGGYATMDGVGRNNMARVHADGTLDTLFNPNPDAVVYSMSVQPDGKIVIGGAFHFVSSAPRGFVARVLASGALDPGFIPNAYDEVYSTTLQPDGKIILGGAFLQMGSAVTRNRIARVNADGTLDTVFNPNVNNRVYCTALQADGKVLLGGDFITVGGVTRNHIARVNADGTLDTAFNPDANDRVNSIVLQADGKIIIGGVFTGVGGIARSRIARLLASGTPDPGFISPNVNLGTQGIAVQGVALQADGRVLIGGTFTTVGVLTRNRIARLNNHPATQSLTAASTTRIQWLRGGTSPEVEQVTFDLSTNGGTVWTRVGTGTRMTGGWELTGLSLPATGHLRARGRTSAGYHNGSSGIVESVAPFTAIAGNNFRISSTVRSGANLVFTFPSTSGLHYTLWHTDSLTSLWTDTGLPVITGDGASQTFTLAAPGAGITKRFYHVQVRQ